MATVDISNIIVLDELDALKGPVAPPAQDKKPMGNSATTAPVSASVPSFDHKAFLRTVPNRPGVYRMYDRHQKIIYVGKAKDLKRRLSSYFQKDQGIKTYALVTHIVNIDFTVTFSESEALILENELIKKYQPHYNILLRDDKSYPFILLTTEDRHPGIFYHRGRRKKNGEYFGPFPDSSAVRDSLRQLQKIFPIRQCEDGTYSHRSRPCLMAQMGKCLAPCVPMSPEKEAHYAEQVQLVKIFLQGNNQALLNELTSRMENHADKLEFEEAAILRDQLRSLRHVQESNSIVSGLEHSVDVIGHCFTHGIFCVHVLFIRHGRILGTRSFFPKLAGHKDHCEVLYSFLTQFYLNEAHSSLIPEEIVLDVNIVKDGDHVEDGIAADDYEVLSQADNTVAKPLPQCESGIAESTQSASTAELAPCSTDDNSKKIVDAQDASKDTKPEILSLHVSELSILRQAIKQQFDHSVRFSSRHIRDARSRYLTLARTNAEVALQSKASSTSTALQRINDLEEVLGISGIERMECYDISHSMGELTVASCVVFNREGSDHSRYRRYNIEGITPGDDFAAMNQVLSRRFADPDSSELPQLVFIDGGKGQLAQAEAVLSKAFANAQSPMPYIVAVAKGEGRKAGLETLVKAFTREEIHLGLSSPALQLVIHIRDESHRFAITGHRNRRSKARQTSKLESIPGIGPKRRQALLKHLGGMQEVVKASVSELQKVPGISKEMAQEIYDSLHG